MIKELNKKELNDLLLREYPLDGIILKISNNIGGEEIVINGILKLLEKKKTEEVVSIIENLLSKIK